MKILVLAKSWGGVEYHRLYNPLKRMQLDNTEIEIFTCESLPDNIEYDMVVFNRYLFQDHYPIMNALKQNGIPYILDLDDYWRLPKFHTASKYFRDNDVSNAIKDAITYAAGVTVTTERLANEVRRMNHNVSILPNTIEWTDDQWAVKKETRVKDKVRFGYVGGRTHENDLQLIHEPMKYILDKYPNVEFHLCGYSREDSIWRRIARQCHDRVILHEGMPVSDYGKLYSLFDVKIVPLEDNKFNNMKSELKVLEAAEYKLPVIASNVSPYKDMEGNNGIMLVAPHEWRAALESFVLSDKSMMGEHNYHYCRTNYSIEKVNEKRLQFYQRICKSATSDRG